MRRFLALLFAGYFLAACHQLPRAQRGGASTIALGGSDAPTNVVTSAPENPQTPSVTTIEKTTVREYAPAQPAAKAIEQPARAVEPAAAAAPASAPTAPALVRETVREHATTQLGIAQKDTARELGVKLASMRGVMWVGVVLLVGGPLLGIKLGWPMNGAIAGAVGLLLIILSQVIPGHGAWFGLVGLLLIPAVAFVYYRARHDSTAEAAERADAKPSPKP